MGEQATFNFAQLNTEAADLHLLIHPTQVFHYAVIAVLHQVAGAVHPLARLTKGIRQKAFGGQVRALVITPGQAHFVADIQLARHANRHAVKILIQHIQFSRPHGGADGCIGTGQGVALVGRPQHRCDHGFRGAVTVENALRFQHLLHALEGFPGESLAAQSPGTHFQCRLCLFDPVQQRPHVAGRNTGNGHAFFLQGIAGLLGAP